MELKNAFELDILEVNFEDNIDRHVLSILLPAVNQLNYRKIEIKREEMELLKFINQTYILFQILQISTRNKCIVKYINFEKKTQFVLLYFKTVAYVQFNMKEIPRFRLLLLP